MPNAILGRKRGGGGEIAEALRSAWRRLRRKQFLFLYPFTLGIINLLAFLAVYVSLGLGWSWSEFARASFSRGEFLQKHLSQLTEPGLPMVIGIVAGLAVCLLAAAVRAPYFRAIIGLGYPLAPRSGEDLGRLFLFYLVTYPIFYLLPYSFPPESGAYHVLMVLVSLLALVLVFGDYAVIFERLHPWRALRRSASLLRKGPGVVIGLYLLAWLALSALHTLYDGVYQRGTGVFPLFPLSQIILESLIVLVTDVFLIFLYDHLRRL